MTPIASDGFEYAKDDRNRITGEYATRAANLSPTS